MDRTQNNSTYNYRKYLAYEAFEKRARGDKKLIKFISKGDFYDIAKSEPEFKVFLPKCVPSTEEIEQAKVHQNLIKRSLLTKEQEAEIDKAAFNKKGIIKIKLLTNKVMNLEGLNKHANTKAGGLPTREELVAAGVNQGDGNNFWQPVINKNGKLDMCQIGNHRISGKRYVLWSEEPENKYSKTWMNDMTPYEFRPLDWMYVKKNPIKKTIFQSNFHLQAEEDKVTKLKKELSIQKNYVAQKQLKIRRENFDYDSEIKMSKTAFDNHNLVRIPINHSLTWT